MGLGGNLMWTAVFREIWKRENNPRLKLLIILNNCIVKENLWLNNPYLSNDPNYRPLKIIDISELNKSGNGTIIVKKSNNVYDTYLDNNHVIKNRCNFFGVKNPELKCDLFFTKDEIRKVESLVKKLPKFICIDPHSKNIYTKNKYYPFHKWQKIRKSIKGILVIQVGVGGKKILNNVFDLTGKLTFRETALLLKYSLLYIGIEGGLGHCCNAVGCPAILIVPAIFHYNLTHYPGNEYIWLGTKQHQRCGMKHKCEKCHTIINNHDENIIIKKIQDKLKSL